MPKPAIFRAPCGGCHKKMLPTPPWPKENNKMKTKQLPKDELIKQNISKFPHPSIEKNCGGAPGRMNFHGAKSVAPNRWTLTPTRFSLAFGSKFLPNPMDIGTARPHTRTTNRLRFTTTSRIPGRATLLRWENHHLHLVVVGHIQPAH